MDLPTQHGCTPHSLEWEDKLQALRGEMEARCQELHRELARCRTRIRQLERAIASNAPSAAPIAGPPDPGRGDDDDGHCPQCDKFGRICYDCDRYLDGLAALGQ